jgi:hypothetical protein
VEAVDAGRGVGGTAKEAAVTPGVTRGAALDFGGTVIRTTGGGGAKVNVGGETFEPGVPACVGRMRNKRKVKIVDSE